MKCPDGNLKVRRPESKRLDPKYTKGTSKRCDGKGAMVWGCFSDFRGVVPIHRINGIMNRFVSLDIIEKKMGPLANNIMALLWTFQQITTRNTGLNLLSNGWK